MRVCTGCKIDKPIKDYQRRKDSLSGFYTKCRVCRKQVSSSYYQKNRAYIDARNKKWNDTHPEKVAETKRKYFQENRERCLLRSKEYHYKSEYGITVQQKDDMIKAQNGACAICDTKNPKGYYEKLHVDHCHKTGKVRGLLCNNCNVGMGYFNEDIELIKKAIEYLNANNKS